MHQVQPFSSANVMTNPVAHSMSHPMDSTRIMLDIMELSRMGEAAQNPDNPNYLNGIISKKLLRDLLAALHIRDQGIVNHSRRVAQLSVGMAQHLGWDEHNIHMIEVVSLLHDIGKIGIPDSILHKPGVFSPDEIELMMLHTSIGLNVLQAGRTDGLVLQIIHQGQALCNGTAEGSADFGREYHLGARILAVADAYDSLTNEQTYRDAIPHKEAIDTLMNSDEGQFDTNLVGALNRWIEEEGLSFFHTADIDQPVSQFAPTQKADFIAASQLCNVFSYMYILESLYDGFYLLDPDLKFLVWNRGAERLFKKSATDMLGQAWSSHMMPYTDQFTNRIPEHDCPVNQVLATGRPMVENVKIQPEENNWVDLELQSMPLRDQQGLLLGIAEIFSDRSRNKRDTGQYKKLRIQASRDALTKLSNRGEMENRLAVLLSKFNKDPETHPLSAIFLDVDHFKSINDTYGHGVGDEVLVGVARLMEQETYSGEVVARYGGEEFVVLCPETTLEQAESRAERIRQALQKAKVSKTEGLHVTASFGVASAEYGDSMASLIKRADKAVYMSKEGGRNRTTKLTNDELLRANEIQQQENLITDGFEFEGKFDAVIEADMVVYKLGGFVDDNEARLMKVEPNRIVLRMGYRGILPFWGSTEDAQPVQMTIEFGTPHRSSKRGASKQVPITIKVIPIGWPRRSRRFQLRAKNAFKAIRSYFAAE